MTGSLYELDDFGENYRIVLKNLILPSFVLGIRPLEYNSISSQQFIEVYHGIH